MPRTAAPTVLVAEDVAPLRAQIAALLQAAGWRVDEAGDGPWALRQALQEPPDVLVLDIGLPGLDGLALCERLRREAPCHVPVLMLTARDTLADKLQGFSAGADDYLVKPFAGPELLARVQALARRPALGRAHRRQIGTLTLDARAHEAWRGERRLVLPPTPFRILQLLAEAWPRPLTRSTLVQALWDADPPDSDPLRTHLTTLRRELDRPPAPPMLKTVHGVGYRLEADAPTGPP